MTAKILFGLLVGLLVLVLYIQFVGIEVGRGYISVDESESRIYPPYTPASKIYWTFTKEYSYPHPLTGHSGAIWYNQPYLAMWEYKMNVHRIRYSKTKGRE